jgi:DNA-binding NarL/FixJ family response regulator
MIVDDNNRDRRIVREMLDWGALDIEITAEAANGQEALDRIAESLPDILITDVSMPVLSGVDLAERIHNMGLRTHVIFMSFYENFEAARSAVDMRVYGYILKPIRRHDLMRALEKVLSIRIDEERRKREHRQLTARIEESIPILRESFLRDLIYGKYKNENEISQRFSFLKIPYTPGMYIQLFCISVREPTEMETVMEQYAKAYALMALFTDPAQTDYRYLVQTAGSEFVLLRIDANPAGDEGMAFIARLYPKIDAMFEGSALIGVSEKNQPANRHQSAVPARTAGGPFPSVQRQDTGGAVSRNGGAAGGGLRRRAVCPRILFYSK